MDVCAAALGIDYSDIREHRTPDSRRFSLRDHTRAIIRREHLHSDHRRFADGPLGWLGAQHSCNVRNPEARLLHLDAHRYTDPDALFVVRSQLMQNRTLHIAVIDLSHVSLHDAAIDVFAIRIGKACSQLFFDRNQRGHDHDSILLPGGLPAAYALHHLADCGHDAVLDVFIVGAGQAVINHAVVGFIAALFKHTERGNVRHDVV